jgi:hypothetical protein
VLGFRLGLRLGEIQRIRLMDIRVAHDPVIWILSNELGDTKTVFAHRRMHLACYLDEDEIDLLEGWCDRRRRSGGLDENPLFPSEGSNTEPVNDDLIRFAVQNAMRRVTGDGLLNFRHLRHSFATWTLLRLMSTQIPKEARESIHALKHPALSEASCSRLREMLSPDTFESMTGLHPVRTACYLVAAQLGHLSPVTGLENYVHFLDLMLVTGSNARQRYSAKEVMAMTGLKQAQAYRLVEQHGQQGTIDGNAMLALLAKRSQC